MADQTPASDTATVQQCLRIVPEFRTTEHPRVLNRLSGRLDRRLSRWTSAQVEMELSVKERDTNSQRVVLEAWIAGHDRFVATSTDNNLHRAVAEVRDNLVRQINRAVERQTTNHHSH